MGQDLDRGPQLLPVRLQALAQRLDVADGLLALVLRLVQQLDHGLDAVDGLVDDGLVEIGHCFPPRS